jgi:3-methyladenine DNA glycosylase AlkD
MNVLEELKQLADSDYKEFNKKIIHTNQEVLGVRMPAMRKLAKQIVKNNPYDFINKDKPSIYEMILMEGLVLSYIDKSFKELLPLTENFLHKVDNWAQVDSTVADYNNIKKEKTEVTPIIKRWLKSKDEFFIRSGLVILLAHYITSDDLAMVFKLSNSITHKGYYVFMANAWLISTCMAKFPIETIEFFKNNKLDDKTHNKAIQKSRESFRVSKENKEFLKTLKR